MHKKFQYRSSVELASFRVVCSNTVWSAFWDPESTPRVFKGLWGCWRLSRAEQRDICPGLEGFHASGRPDDLGPLGLPAGRGSRRVNLTQMDPHASSEHTHGETHIHMRTHICEDRCKCGHIGAKTHLDTGENKRTHTTGLWTGGTTQMQTGRLMYVIPHRHYWANTSGQGEDQNFDPGIKFEYSYLISSECN